MKRRYDAYRRPKRNIDYDKKRGVNIILNITFTTIPIMPIIRLIIEIINFYYRQLKNNKRFLIYHKKIFA